MEQEKIVLISQPKEDIQSVGSREVEHLKHEQAAIKCSLGGEIFATVSGSLLYLYRRF